MTYLAKQIQSSLVELSDGKVAHRALSPFLVQLREVWEPPPAMAPSIEESSEIWGEPMFMPAVPQVPPAPPRRPPPWYLGMSSAFSRAIMGIDRKLQGRILEAVTNIVEDPLKVRGDTVKP